MKNVLLNRISIVKKAFNKPLLLPLLLLLLFLLLLLLLDQLPVIVKWLFSGQINYLYIDG